MIRIRFRLRGDWRIAAVVVAVLLLLPLSGSVAALDDGTGAPADVESIAAWAPNTAGRHFYLTSTVYAADHMLTACATGYHEASLWEILDPSHMDYDYGHPAALSKADSGHGPPAGWNGWVRTGQDSSGSAVAGTGNCKTWTSKSGSDYGVAVRLSNSWVTAPGDISVWQANEYPCSYTGPVWCVADFQTSYLPGILKRR